MLGREHQRATAELPHFTENLINVQFLFLPRERFLKVIPREETAEHRNALAGFNSVDGEEDPFANKTFSIAMKRCLNCR